MRLVPCQLALMGKREDWMLTEGKDPLISLLKDTNKRPNEKEKIEPTVSSREINPNLRSGISLSPSSSTSHSWQKMLVQKALDRVKRGEVNLEDVANERFGSVEAFEDACRAVNVSIGAYLGRPAPGQRHERIAQIEDKVNFEAEDVNKLTARKLKAEMMGDLEQARQLDEQISAIASKKTKGIIPRHELKPVGHIEEKADLRAMVEHEKRANKDEFDQELARKITKSSRFSTRQEDLEDFSDRYGESSSKKTKIDPDEVKRRIALGNYKKMERMQRNCWFCLDSDRADKSLIVAHGQHTYLALPKYKALDPLHCQIIPLEHTVSTLQCDELVWNEIRNCNIPKSF